MVAIVGKLIAAAAGALVGAAVAKELDKPSDQRGWHGEVGGVPYDFRRPTADKIRRSAWDPDNPEVFVPHAFGVGWSINFARLAEWVQPPPAAESSPVQAELTPAPAQPELVAAPAATSAPAAAPAATAAAPATVPAADVAAPVPGMASAPEPDAAAVPGTATAPESVAAPGTVAEPEAAAVPITPATTSEPDAPETPATPAPAADTPETPAGPTDATGDSRG
jgi:hypothetical protein